MEDNDRREPDVTPRAIPRLDDDTIRIREATSPPVYPDPPPTLPTGAPVVEPTAVLPTQPAPAARALTPLAPTPAPLYPERRLVREERAAWPYVLALFALLAGGLGGYLIGAALDDDDEPITGPAPASLPADGSDVGATLDMLLARTQADGEYRTPSEYAQLDQITEIDSAAATAELEEQLATLTAAQGDAAQLAEQVTALETALTDVTAERDQLAAQIAESGDADGDTQAQLDAANAQIATLESELDTARADLDTARTDLDTANASLQQAQSELTEVTAQLDALDLIAAPNYVNGDIARARSDAASNGWTLIEEPAASPNTPAGTVLEQVPAAGANMVRGSVLYVTFAENV